MIIYIIPALILGVLAGTITGLIPGIHVNLISVFLISTSAFLLAYFSPVILGAFIIAMAITHTFLDFIPSIFLGAPDEDTALSILPGHELLNKGKGYEAIILTLFGSVIGIIIILFLVPLFLLILPKIYTYLKFSMFLILISASIYLIAREKQSKILAIVVFFLAGFLGLSTFNLNIENSLLPLLTGLFGSSSLITSIMKKEKIPKQKLSKIRKLIPGKKQITNSSLAAILSAPLCTFLPSLGASQAAVIGSDIIGEKDRKQFLILLGNINTIVAGLAFITLIVINQTRTGTSLALSEINIQPHIILILLTIIFSSFLAFFLTIYIGKFFAQKITKINYKYLSLSVLLFLALLVFLFSGLLGLLVFIIATSTGLIAILTKIRRTHLMGALMLPTILLYLPF